MKTALGTVVRYSNPTRLMEQLLLPGRVGASGRTRRSTLLVEALGAANRFVSAPTAAVDRKERKELTQGIDVLLDALDAQGGEESNPPWTSAIWTNEQASAVANAMDGLNSIEGAQTFLTAMPAEGAGAVASGGPLLASCPPYGLFPYNR